MPREIISVQLGQCGNQSKYQCRTAITHSIVLCVSWNGVLETAVR